MICVSISVCNWNTCLLHYTTAVRRTTDMHYIKAILTRQIGP